MGTNLAGSLAMAHSLSQLHQIFSSTPTFLQLCCPTHLSQSCSVGRQTLAEPSELIAPMEPTAANFRLALAVQDPNPTLIGAGLDHPEDSVRTVAVGAAARCGLLTPQLLDRLLEDRSGRVRRRAIAASEAVGELNEILARHISNLLEDDDLSVAIASLDAVARNGWLDRLGQVCDLARNAPTAIREQSVVTIAELHQQGGADQTPSSVTLGDVGPADEAVVIAAALGDVATVRRRAVAALAAFDTTAAEEALRAGLNDRDLQVRQICEDLLGERGSS